MIGSGQFTEPLSAGHCGISAGGTLTGPAEGDLGDWVAASAGSGGDCPPGASHPPPRGIDRTNTFNPCIPNFYL